MKQGELLDVLNRMTYSEIVYYVYRYAFDMSPVEVASNRSVKLRTAYKNIEKADKCIEHQEDHNEIVAALQELFSDKISL